MLVYGKPVDFANNESEFVYSSSAKFTPGVIRSAATSIGIQTSIMIRNLATRILHNIKLRPDFYWPPTPNQIIESIDEIDLDLCNFLVILISSKPSFDKGVARLTRSKAVKIVKISEDIESMIPSRKPSLSQVLMSLTLHLVTGLSNVVKDIHHYGHGVSYIETIFIQDKWAEWCEKQSSLIPSNIESRKLVTHIVDNIDWENKSLTVDQNRHMNSIIIQRSIDSRNDIPSVALEPDYNFKRSAHKSFNGTQFNLPNIIFKTSEAKLPEYESEGEISIDNNETKISNSRNFLWAFLRMNKVEENPENQDIPGWSGFQELCGELSFPVRVGYLPPTRAPITKMRVIYAVINR